MNMQEDTPLKSIQLDSVPFPVHQVHTLIIGSGTAALKAANRLHQLGIEDIIIITESLKGGTSYNTGSDKQTYYRLATNTKEPDSPYMMAQDLFQGGAMHGDIALVESMGSAEGFYYLSSIGVPFPIHTYGGYVGYKTDHDSRERGCSIGPYTSKKMVEALLQEVNRRDIPIHEHTEVISLIKNRDRIVGAVAIDRKAVLDETYGLRLYMAENVVFGVGGPGGIYEDSVYPACHSGAIGLALEIGAEANNLTESQFGLASTKFRWNVSGSYQQVIPAYISTDSDGNDPREFLQPFFQTTEELCNAIFLKGYQWPFDVNKIMNGGSSLIDILVYREQVLLGRKVFMDFRRNPSAVPGSHAFSLDAVGTVARTYLERSDALAETPFKRLQRMNPQAIALYRDHGIDLETEPLEVAVSAQHNNGGLSVDLWWESVNIKHLFPVGEVAGTHGVARPGGSALNSGQVGGERAARKIAGSYQGRTVSWDDFEQVAVDVLKRMYTIAKHGVATNVQSQNREVEALAELGAYRRTYRQRMSKVGAMTRSKTDVEAELKAAELQVDSFRHIQVDTRYLLPKLFQTRHLVLAHHVYLSAIAAYLSQGGGSRGSALVLHSEGKTIHDQLEAFWRYLPEQEYGRHTIMSTRMEHGSVVHEYIQCRAIPDDDFWFETVWRDFLSGTYLQT